jgi:hypothetical protein
MQHAHDPIEGLLGSGYWLAPLQSTPTPGPLNVCLLVRTEPKPGTGPFVLLREVPLAPVYLGAVVDAQGRVQEWVEIWNQSFEVAEIVASQSHEKLSNFALDQRWTSECEMDLKNTPGEIIWTGMEIRNPQPLLIEAAAGNSRGFAVVENSGWELCRDDAVLDSFGLEPYSTSTVRYLHQPQAGEPKTFLPGSPDSPVNAHVQPAERFLGTAGRLAVFNPHAGLIRVKRFSPLHLEDYAQVLEGRAWEGVGPGTNRLFQDGLYAELQSWSGKPKGLPFLLHGAGSASDRVNEVLLLKLSLLQGMFRAVRAYVAAQQTPVLNLSPASFTVSLPEVGEQLPALWSARCSLTRPGQGYPLTIKSTQHRYFLRLGRVEPSIFLPEGLGAHSFGIGTIRKRDVRSEADGTVFEGTLVAEDYLGLDPHDLLWFKLPVSGQGRLEFYAHVYKGDSVGPKEARFRTVPTRLDESVLAVLKTSGAFARAPYEIWPLLSSPCDLYSLGVIGIRLLLANSQTPLPVVVDDVLGFSRRIGKDLEKPEDYPARLRSVLQGDQELLDVLSPHRLTESEATPEQARANIHLDLWLDSIGWLLRLFPGAGQHSYCQDFGDVSPLALETIFDRPIEDLDRLLIRLRSVLLPTSAMNAEIAEVIFAQLKGS